MQHCSQDVSCHPVPLRRAIVLTDTDFEVVIAGSGVGGLIAAIRTSTSGKRTLLVEAAAKYGGTSALSAGRVWFPKAPAQDLSHADSAERYLDALMPDSREAVRAFMEASQRVFPFVEANSRHRFTVCPNYPDYHQELEDASPGGRCYDSAVVSIHDLLPEAREVRESPGYIPILQREWEEWRYPENFDWQLITERYERGQRTGGYALVAALVDGALRAGATLVRNTKLVDIEVTATGVAGVRLEADGENIDVTCSNVILSTGGFDGSQERRAEFLAGVTVSGSAPSNTGVALDIAEKLDLPQGDMSLAWLMPMAEVPGDTVDGHPYPRFLPRERAVPNCVIVNAGGERFANEAAPYHRFVTAMLQSGSEEDPTAYLIFDEEYRRRYPFPGLSRTGRLEGPFVIAESMVDLATKIGVPSYALEATIRRWNDFCGAGADEDFHRGGNAYDRHNGDPWQKGNPCLGPVDTPPYYATRILPGTIGSKGGLVTDASSRVVDHNGAPIVGLYAAGTVAATWTGDTYPGPGFPLSLSMAAGLVAAEQISRSDRAVGV
ncbi:MAG: FAD-dependent oxidoreductase [Hyphomicrobiales bacterium]|nr:MAG: FAD-dependent oxidoreductase [Hyphomicrobiales bacterium]